MTNTNNDMKTTFKATPNNTKVGEKIIDSYGKIREVKEINLTKSGKRAKVVMVDGWTTLFPIGLNTTLEQ